MSSDASAISSAVRPSVPLCQKAGDHRSDTHTVAGIGRVAGSDDEIHSDEGLFVVGHDDEVGAVGEQPLLERGEVELFEWEWLGGACCAPRAPALAASAQRTGRWHRGETQTWRSEETGRLRGGETERWVVRKKSLRIRALMGAPLPSAGR